LRILTETKLQSYSKLTNLKHFDKKLNKIIGSRDTLQKLEFKNFLRDILRLSDFKGNKDMRMFEKMISILTPFDQSLRPVLSYRNLKCILTAMFKGYEPWMKNQDPIEIKQLGKTLY
jgi:hypothetical protein